MSILTPTVAAGAKKSLFWAGALAFLLLFAIGSLLLTGAATETDPLSPENPAPDGTMAVYEVLRDRGVAVETTETLEATTAAVRDPATTTLLVYDPENYLADDQWGSLLGLAGHLVVLEPGTRALQAIAPGVSPAGVTDDDPLEAGCALPAAAAAGSVSPGGLAYRAGEEAGNVDACLRSDSDGADDAYSLIRVPNGGSTVSIVGATEALTNGSVTSLGNAAFALTLLGENSDLVWYLPSVADSGAVDPSSLTPTWLSPVIVLIVATVAAAAFWRGRRFGPLIVENLPVTVRASETMEGRARLYQQGSARLRALDALRMATVSRLAARCGLPRTATLDEVRLAVAAILGGPEADVRAVLVDEVPASDADLVRLSDRLLELEAAVDRAAGP